MIVLVKFRVRDADAAQFARLLQENATASLAEAGCTRFDIARAETDGQPGYEFLLWEIYRDRAAFDRHLATAHFAAFEQACAGRVLSKEVTLGQLTAPEHKETAREI